MKNAALLDQRAVDLAGAQLGVGAGLARKREGPLAVGCQGNKGQRSEGVGVRNQVVGVDAFGL